MKSIVRLGDVCRYDKQQGLHSGLPYLGLEHIESGSGRFDLSPSNPDAKSQTFHFSEKHVLYGRLRPYLKKVALPERNGRCSTEIFPILPGERLDRRYLSYWLLSDETTNAINATCTGARMPRADMGAVLDLPLFAPNLKEQRRIVTNHDEAFAGIATAKANAEKSLQSAADVFGKRLLQVFSGHHPGWKVRRLDEVCAITSVLVDPRHPEYIDAIHVGAGNIESKTGRLIDLKTSREESLISGKFPFDETMVLYSKFSPYLEKVARPEFSGICSADMYPLAPIQGCVTRNFLYWLLLSKSFTDYAISGSARAGMPKVNREHLFQYATEFPGVDEQRRISTELDELRAEVSRLQSLYTRKLAALDELKQSLLQQAFSGQL